MNWFLDCDGQHVNEKQKTTLLGSKYLRIKYLESLTYGVGKPRLKHV